jgi:hypothetical protein
MLSSKYSSFGTNLKKEELDEIVLVSSSIRIPKI